jgi:hypothetical protein
MKKSKISNRDIPRISAEEIEKMRLKRIKKIQAMSAEFQLGLYVGEELVRRCLPTLDVDMIQTRNILKVLPEEKEEIERLDKIWFNSQDLDGNHSKEAWDHLRESHKRLEEKYLPQELICRIPPVNIKNEKDFKEGIAISLWDSDLSHYKCSGPEDIEFWLEEDAYFTIVKLKRG